MGSLPEFSFSWPVIHSACARCNKQANEYCIIFTNTPVPSKYGANFQKLAIGAILILWETDRPNHYFQD